MKAAPDTSTLRQRLDFIEIDDATRETLRELRPTLSELLGGALDKLYAKMGRTPAISHFFRDKAHMDGAKARQESHWGHLSNGQFDANYVAGVTAVGKTHARIGLDPSWYIGGYALVLTELMHGILHKHWPSRFGKRHAPGLSNKLAAVVKATFLDIDYAISVYLAELDEKRQVLEQDRTRAEADQRIAMEHLSRGLESLSKGDFEAVLPENLPGAFQKMASDYNNAVAALRHSIGGVRATSEGVLSGTDLMSKATDDLSMRTAQQAAGVEQSSAALQQLAVSVGQTASNAARASVAVGETQQQAKSSGDLVNSAVAAMAEIEKSSTEISKIIGVIDEIAFQTNLLALNAGVEAARAGDAGKGFAVVAQEVRQLAQRSASAAKEIKDLISQSSTQVHAGVTIVSSTGVALADMISRIDGVNKFVGDIAAAAKDQAIGVAEVSAAVRNMDTITQQNAAMVERTSAETRHLRNEANTLVALLSGFKTQADIRNGNMQGEKRRAA
ncbi:MULTISPECIES: globin-coupled sensor protein [unclassified Rhizobium]|uniref:globin-coupled sensor protein n=1 Tax=unclassified Rhizobium TaxID=2613769 RepID=UPI001AD9F47B|nr:MULTISPECIES: globin-coupled sensor protein [unclassified Rhizobium]MBO9097119.1 globin-coupled sensor protein [Rhizobium sp. L58/93]MBO9134029.1 globin-coupled sensor protein [Rhizobium sp. B209b/85]MBO9167357.1 globin-coupled sensor protein [Rhizobium sp. L245/93]MBO9183316.1 globin-coupled sensor protein [Rhizobium sp. E27B/91]QXZ83657.1 globin-coupled sensor protein [Rhizobium sp. K1/93]